MEELKIVYLPPNQLIPYENNAKLHPAEQVAKIANSLQRFGFRKPVVIDENNVLVAGHGAVLAAQMLGLERVPCVKTGDLTEAEVAAYRLADNETNKGENDFEKLEAELEMLRESDLEFDMSEFGFDDIQGEVSEPYTGQGATEYGEEDFGDDKFKCECPRCGFKFNP